MQTSECKDTSTKGISISKRDENGGEINPRRITVTTVIGNKVMNGSGKEIGKIEDIVIDLTCGNVSYLVVSSGGFAGIGDKFFAVPLEALTMDLKKKTFMVEIDKNKLRKARGFDKNSWPVKAIWPPDHKSQR
jgi:sporulation protein YlmC with PRC-barrel domain